MNREVYLVYKTDAEFCNPELAGCFSSKEKAILSIIDNCQIDVDDSLLHTPKNMAQADKAKERDRRIRMELEVDYKTSGYEINYFIDIIRMDEWVI